jgi:hypothetical protein
VRIIEACTDIGTLSPTEILNQGLCADVPGMKGKTLKQQLSSISYHCRELEKAGLLALVRERQVRGATEHFYRAESEAFFTTAEWKALTDDQRHDISRVMWQRFEAQVESAMHNGTFDSRLERMLAWSPVMVDEKGWKEMSVSIEACYAEMEQIRKDAAARLADSDEEPMRATFGLFTFLSPIRRAPEKGGR